MPGKQRGIPAGRLARDFGLSLNQFADEVIAMLARLDGEGSPARSAAHRREICAAVSAALAMALDASTLSPDERAKLKPLLHEVLIPFWTKHCASTSEDPPRIAQRADHYLQGRVPGSQVKSAVNLVAALLDALEVSTERRDAFSKALSPAFAHRMVADAYHLSDLRSRFGVELSLLAAMATMLQVLMSCDSILKALRIT
jgi:hypothetical protein